MRAGVEMIVEIASALIKAEAGRRLRFGTASCPLPHAPPPPDGAGQHALLEYLIAAVLTPSFTHHVRRQVGAFAAEAVGYPEPMLGKLSGWWPVCQMISPTEWIAESVCTPLRKVISSTTVANRG